ncbi:MAG: aminoacyl-tRNA hydrolase, partial [Deltaproteobacteria bacterium]|nr:aminoacyl-tRNA hydrolase [Deltaproteobacteria bacterium]
GRGTVRAVSVIVAKPTTFMNRVGPAIRDFAQVWAIDSKDILVIHDDIDIAFGKLKIKEKGGDGGHNGVKSLIAALGTDAFVRIRVGIGRPEVGSDVRGYVLEEFDVVQQVRLETMLAAARHAAETVLCEGASKAMNLFHGKTITKT